MAAFAGKRCIVKTWTKSRRVNPTPLEAHIRIKGTQHPGTWVPANPPIVHLMTHGEASGVAGSGISSTVLPPPLSISTPPLGKDRMQ